MENENLRFECAFSEKAIRNNNLSLKIFVLFLIICLCFSMYMSGFSTISLWYSFSCIIFSVLLSLYSMMYVRKMAKRSYLEITTDGILKCVYYGRKEVSYPIKEMRLIEESSFKDARKKYASVPIVLNSKGDDLYPPEGVLITFNRAWIKSVFPVYFNPVNIEGFISAIRKRIKPAEEDSKFEGKD